MRVGGMVTLENANREYGPQLPIQECSAQHTDNLLNQVFTSVADKMVW